MTSPPTLRHLAADEMRQIASRLPEPMVHFLEAKHPDPKWEWYVCLTKDERDSLLSERTALREALLDVTNWVVALYGDDEAGAQVKASLARARALVEDATLSQTPEATRACPDCRGRGWHTPTIKQYPGDRVACRHCWGTGELTR